MKKLESLENFSTSAEDLSIIVGGESTTTKTPGKYFEGYGTSCWDCRNVDGTGWHCFDGTKEPACNCS